MSREAVSEAKALYRLARVLVQKSLQAYAPVSLHFRLAVAKGTLDWLSPQRRAGLMETLETHLGETTSRQELRRIARRHLQALRKFDFVSTWPQVRNFAGVEAIGVEGLEHLDEALARGKGALLVSTHYGFSRMIKPVLRSHGRRVLLVGPLPHLPRRRSHRDGVSRRRPTRADRLARKLHPPRARSDALAGDIQSGLNLRPVVEALERNAPVIILADGHAEALHGLPVAGIEIPFAPGAVNLARATGAALLPAFVVDEPGRTGPASLRLIIHPPLDLQVTDDRRADTEVNLQRFAAVYGEQIRAYPHDFAWGVVRNGAYESPAPRGPRGDSPAPPRSREAPFA